MKQITAVEKPKKTVLPEGKLQLDDIESRALIEHCRKLIRDGLVSQVWAVLNIAAACYNIRRFELFTGMGYRSFDDAIEHEFGFTKRHGNKYAMIGERLADALGGGSITQRMLQERMERDVWESRLGFRQIHTLARTSDGITRLLDARNEGDVEDLLDELRTGAQAIREELDNRPKTPLKAALSKRYDPSRPPTPTDLNVLFNAATRQLVEFNSKYLSRLRDACRALDDGNAYTDSKKYPRKAQRLWITLRDTHEMLREVAALWPDLAEEASRIIGIVRAMPPDEANDVLAVERQIEQVRQQRRAGRPSKTIPRTLPDEFRTGVEEAIPMTEEEQERFLRDAMPPIPSKFTKGLPDPADLLDDDDDDEGGDL